MAKKRIRDLNEKQFLSPNDVVLLDQNSQTLSVSLSSIGEFIKSYIYGGTLLDNVLLNKGSDIITVDNTVGLVLGMKIYGLNIPDNSYITEITGSTTFKISNAATDTVLLNDVLFITTNPVVSEGRKYSGSGDGKTGIKDLIYKDGVPYSGYGDDVSGKKGILYSHGIGFSGLQKQVGKNVFLCYKDGLPFTGTGDGKVGEDGVVYQDGIRFTGTGTTKLGEDKKVYSNGILYTGVGTKTLGKPKIIYKDGIPFNGTGDGKVGLLNVVYVDGATSVIVTGTGQPFNGVGDGTLGTSNVLYKIGVPFNGIGTGGTNGGILNLLYSNGLLFTGKGDSLVGINGKIYKDGDLFDGKGDGKLLGESGKIYKDGELFDGTGNGTIGTADIVYMDGLPFNGTGDGTVGVNTKIYKSGKLYTGVGTADLGKPNILYYLGVPYTGSGTTDVGVVGTDYTEGKPVVKVNNSAFTGLGNGSNGGLDGVWYSNGIKFDGTGNGTIGVADIVYDDGLPYNGLAKIENKINIGVAGTVYKAGKPYTGKGVDLIGELGVIYKLGIKFSGFADGTIPGSIDHTLYKDGVPYNGIGNKNIGKTDIVYKNGLPYDGYGDATLGASTVGVLYDDGVPYTGSGHDNLGSTGTVYSLGLPYDGNGNSAQKLGVDGVFYKKGVPFNGFENNVLYSNGKTYNGIGTGNIGTLGVSYTNGVTTIVSTVNRQIFSGTYASSIAITPNGHVFEWGGVYPRIYNGIDHEYLPSLDFEYATRVLLPTGISGSVRSMTAPLFVNSDDKKRTDMVRYALTDNGKVYSIKRNSNVVKFAVDSTAILVSKLPKILKLEQNNKMVLALGEDNNVYELSLDQDTPSGEEIKVFPDVIDVKLAKTGYPYSRNQKYQYTGLILTKTKESYFFEKNIETGNYVITKVGVLQPIKYIASGPANAVIAENGNVYFFGDNTWYEIPFKVDTITIPINAPLEIPSLRNIVKEIVIGDSVCGILNTNNVLSTFGSNTEMRDKYNLTKYNLPSVSSIHIGGANIFAVGTNGILSSFRGGTVYNNFYGELGNGKTSVNYTDDYGWKQVKNLPNLLTTENPPLSNLYTQTYAGDDIGFTNTVNTAARFYDPVSICKNINNTIIYIADKFAIRQIYLHIGKVITLVGGGYINSTSGDKDGTNKYEVLFTDIRGIVLKDTFLYIIDGNKIKKITLTKTNTFASCTTIYGAKAGQLTNPSGIAIDKNNLLYVSDTGKHRILRMTTNGAGVITYAGGGSNGSTSGNKIGLGNVALFESPKNLTIVNNILYISDTGNNLIKKIDLADTKETVSVFVGGNGAKQSGSVDGTGKNALFNAPLGIQSSGDEKSLFIADTGNHKIRTVEISTGIVKTYVGGDNAGNISGFLNDTGIEALFSSPKDIIAISNLKNSDIIVVDSGNKKLRKVVYPAVVQTYSGSTQGTEDDVNTIGLFKNLGFMDFDAQGVLYVADTGNHKIRKITTDGIVSTLAGGGYEGNKSGVIHGTETGVEALFNSPVGVAINSNNLYVTDTANHQIRKIDSNGLVTNIAGGGTTGLQTGSVNGTGQAALFKNPEGIALDSSGNIYVADTGNHKIRKITTGGVVTTLAGGGRTGIQSGNSIGTGDESLFNNPRGLTIDSSNNLYVTDTGNDVIKKITPQGVVTTFATGLNDARAINIDSSGNIYVAEYTLQYIKKITPQGVQSIIIGDVIDINADRDGVDYAASFGSPNGIAVNPNNEIYINGNNKIRKIVKF